MNKSDEYRIERHTNECFGAAYRISTGKRIHTPRWMGMDEVMIQIRYDIDARARHNEDTPTKDTP